jgi:hypothetical protein
MEAVQSVHSSARSFFLSYGNTSLTTRQITLSNPLHPPITLKDQHYKRDCLCSIRCKGASGTTHRFVRITDSVLPMDRMNSSRRSFQCRRAEWLRLGYSILLLSFMSLRVSKAGVQLLYFTPGIVSGLSLRDLRRLALLISRFVYVTYQGTSSNEANYHLCLSRSSCIYWATN